ncbi:MAG TPA: type II toxin-antitoxin system VapC family toxin [Acidimicrobiales bacterium]
MRVLLDTHAFLWAHSEPERLGDHRALLEHVGTQRLVSAVVGWEITIKHGLGRLTLPLPPQQWVPDRMRRGAMTPLPIEMTHVLGVAELPDHHKDPFDRLLISQARALGVPIVSADSAFEDYDVEVLAIR